MVTASRLEQRHLRAGIIESEMKHLIGQLPVIGSVKNIGWIARGQIPGRDAIPGDDLAEKRDNRSTGGVYGSRHGG